MITGSEPADADLITGEGKVIRLWDAREDR
jgi:hypothetical protein